MSNQPAWTPPTLGPKAIAAQQPLHLYHAYQGETNNCGPYSTAIAANGYLGQAALDPQQVAETMSHWLYQPRPLPHWSLLRLPNGATLPWGIAAFLRAQGIPARWHWHNAEERLRSNLEAGLITIVLIGDLIHFRGLRWEGWAHAKVLYAHDPDYGYAFVDPGYEADASAWGQAGIFWQRLDEFREEWGKMGRITVVLGET
jgi:hypothetical protein